MSEPQQFRTRVRHVEAIRWTGDNADAIAEWTGGRFHEIDPEDRIDDPEATAEVLGNRSWLPLATGDWIVKIDDRFTWRSDDQLRREYEETPRE